MAEHFAVTTNFLLPSKSRLDLGNVRKIDYLLKLQEAIDHLVNVNLVNEKLRHILLTVIEHLISFLRINIMGQLAVVKRPRYPLPENNRHQNAKQGLPYEQASSG